MYEIYICQIQLLNFTFLHHSFVDEPILAFADDSEAKDDINNIVHYLSNKYTDVSENAA